ncbi:MAG: hypothetical protein ABR981_03530 [Candidatus Micrarchaeaceae archaeon]|jgi:hypothetical protein
MVDATINNNSVSRSRTVQELINNVAKLEKIEHKNRTYNSSKVIASILFYSKHNRKNREFSYEVREHMGDTNKFEATKIENIKGITIPPNLNEQVLIELLQLEESYTKRVGSKFTDSAKQLESIDYVTEACGIRDALLQIFK